MDTAAQLPATASAIVIRAFGGVDTLELAQVSVPRPSNCEVLISVKAAGVGAWDAWIRSGKSVLPQPLPLTLGSDIAGIVVAVGPDVVALHVGDEVYGVTNLRFTNGYAQFALAQVVIARTGSLSMYNDSIDVVVDLVGKEAIDLSWPVLRKGGVLISAVAEPDEEKARTKDIRCGFLLVQVNTEILTTVAKMFEDGKLHCKVGEVMPLSEARKAHEMLDGAPHKSGRIVLLPNH